ncbi:methylamine utilization protein [Glaciecola sp. MH2013]|nr:methylamine utilization protein [Glaciecola sp. MH2013]
MVEIHYRDNGSSTSTANTNKLAVMDQVDEQFYPHILAIEKGTSVSFPNSDNIKHHVYSFSETKVFEQGLYKGRQAPPIVFEKSGVVDLGCNIHDWMLGYIYIADSALFAKTNKDGKAFFNQNSLSDKDISHLSIWHPRMREDEQRIKLTYSGKSQVHQLTNAMQEDFDGYEALSIEEY